MEESSYIKRLKERIRQKPASKLFLSLAEELKKRDRIDDAISILLDGIKKNPEFAEARITLGRWYLSSNMPVEAQKEFADVLAASPDNVFARKGLAEAYENLELTDRAAEEYRKVLEIAPQDRDAISYLESRGFETQDVVTDHIDLEAEEASPDTSAPEILMPSLEEVTEVEVPGVEIIEGKRTEEEQREGKAPRADDLAGLPDFRASGLLAEAEGAIAAGKYAKALGIYNSLLASDRENKKILQMKEDLASLMRLTGWDKERIISRLNRFSGLLHDHFKGRRESEKKVAVDRLTKLLESVNIRFAQKQ